MGMRRDARKHDTVAVRQHQSVRQEDFWEYQPEQRVMTVDGPGRVIAVYDGPYPGSEEYEIRLEGGLGGGRYDAGQIEAASSVEASVGHTEATGLHTADQDYPELGTLLHDRPDPASLRYTAELGSGGTSVTPHASPAADGEAGDAEGQIAWNPGEYNEAQYHRPHDWTLARSINGEHIDDHGTAPHWVRAGNPNEYDELSTEGEPDPKWIEDIDKRQQAMASHPEDEPHGDDGHNDDDFDEDNMCAVEHEGTCEEAHDRATGANRHLAMPSIRHPEHPEGFETRIERSYKGDTGSSQNLVGYINGRRVGHINYSMYGNGDPEKADALKVNFLHTGSADPSAARVDVRTRPTGTGRGVASALMDHLYEKHPQAWINHGYRTSDGLKWWRRYQEPDPGRNVHNVHPSEGWNRYFDPEEVASDVRENEDKDPGHHTDSHDVGWAFDEYLGEGDGETYQPSPTDHALHHGTAVQLPLSTHRIVHNSDLPVEQRARHLLDHLGRGNMPEYNWHMDRNEAAYQAHTAHPEASGDTFGNTEPTQVMLHLDPPDHKAVSDEDVENYHEYGGGAFDMPGREGQSRHLRLRGISWAQKGRAFTGHTFEGEGEPVGIKPDDAALHNPMRRGHAETVRAHEEHAHRYAPHQSPLNPPGTGEQMKLFASSLPTLARQTDSTEDEDPEDGPRYDDFSGVPNLEHPFWGGAFNPTPGAAERAVTESVPAEVHPDDIPRDSAHLSMLVTAAMDPSFRFHVTAAWRDVQTKAKRIRSSGGVDITYADEGVVLGNVRGDHNVYETGLQRVVGKRQSVATYTCGCKWGAYHWGASDDLSRFAGRMCSHALALQYEAASRGMFGRDVEADDARPKWVPSKVVVKYDIDTGQHIRATASVPEHSPLMVAIASMEDDDPAAHVILAAVNDLFGDTSGYTEPSLMSPMGPTIPWNTDESPASAGPLKAAEPHNWGSITGPTMLPRIGRAISTEAFWQAIAPIVRAVAPAIIGHEVDKHTEPEGTSAILHEEPEGALPETDGHTASMGDVDLTGGSGIGGSGSVEELADDDLSPENPSIMTQGSSEDLSDIVASFQRSAGAKTLMAGGPKGDESSSDIAKAAEAYLAKTAASFSRAEQDALIHESPGVQASNTDRLDIAGTHYADLEKMDPGEDDLWLMM